MAEENRQLRQLLNKHGFSDDYITRFLQAGVAGAPDMNRGQPYTTGDPGMAVHALQQAMVARRPASLDSNAPFSVTSQVLSDSSISSTPSVSSSAPWDALQAESSYAHDHGMHLQATPMAGQPSQQQYSAALFMGGQQARGQENYLNQSTQMGGMNQATSLGQPIPQQNRSQMQYNTSMSNYQSSHEGSYGDAPSGGWTG